jgi:hypothetical protein
VDKVQLRAADAFCAHLRFHGITFGVTSDQRFSLHVYFRQEQGKNIERPNIERKLTVST